MKVNFKQQMRSKYFWLSLVSLVILLFQQLGLNVLPENTQEVANTVLTILVALGILNNNSTEGFGE